MSDAYLVHLREVHSCGRGLTVSWRAAVDLGSLSTSLLLTDGAERVRRSVDTFMGGATLSSAGELRSRVISPEALTRVSEALRSYRRLCDERGATIRAVTTAGGRRATNANELIELIHDCLGVELHPIEEDHEARLAFLGASSVVDGGSTAPVVAIDIGGGSTEFAIGSLAGVDATWSLPIGGSLVTETYLDSDPPRPEELSGALTVVELHVDDLVRERPTIAAALQHREVVVVVTGGAVAVAAVEVGLADVDPLNGDGDGPLHRFELDRDAVEDVFRTVATEARVDRLHNPGLPATRVDDIVGGSIVLVQIMRQLDLDTVIISQRGLADGLLVEW